MNFVITKKHIKYNYNPGVNIFPQLWGMVVHCTDDPGASDENEFSYFNGGDRQASAHCFIDNDSITQTVIVDPLKVERTWHAGRTANDHYIGVELCMPVKHDAKYFNNVWNRSVWYFAYIFAHILKLETVNGPVYSGNKVVSKGNLMSHNEVTLLWRQSTHTDPVAYFAEYGKTVNDFRLAVQYEINSMLKPAAPFRLKVINVSTSLNIRSGPSINSTVIGSLRNGNVVDGISYVSGWYKIKWQDVKKVSKTGYVNSQYVIKI